MKKIIIIGLSSLVASTSLFAGANAGKMQLVFAGQKVQLNGKQSAVDHADEHGKFVDFTWKQVSGQPHVRIVNNGTATPVFRTPRTLRRISILKFRLITKEIFIDENEDIQSTASKDFVNIVIQPVLR